MMNKTINISLGNIYFYVDEFAFQKLNRYLKEIESYLANEESRDEIINDIESRIAEIFNNFREDATQVINMHHVDEMIKIMGNPEDYQVEDDYETYSKRKSTRSLYRDVDNSTLAGVCAGLAHYFSINPIWSRILFIILGITTLGTTVLVYIILWILIPPAITTAEKLAMKGEEINISNIEKKVKENYEKFTQKFGDIDYEKYKEQTQQGARKAGQGFINFSSQLLNITLKILGFIFALIGGLALFGLVVALLSYTSVSLFEDFYIFDFPHAEMGVPHWFFASVIFILSAIPMFYLLILGLKLMIKNLRSLGKAFHIIILTLWFASLITIIFLGIRKSFYQPEEYQFVRIEETNITAQDTISIKMIENFRYNENSVRSRHLKLTYDANDQDIATGSMILLDFKNSQQDHVSIRLETNIKSINRESAKKINDELEYQFQTLNKDISLANFYTIQSKYQEARIKLKISIILPEGIHLKINENTTEFLNNHNSINSLEINHKNELLKLENSALKCLSCPYQSIKPIIKSEEKQNRTTLDSIN